MAPENPLASRQRPQFMGNNLEHQRRCVWRLQAQAHGHATRRASMQRRTRDLRRSSSYYSLDKKEISQRYCTVTAFKVVGCRVCSV
jgi:hypothetical protein